MGLTKPKASSEVLKERVFSLATIKTTLEMADEPDYRALYVESERRRQETERRRQETEHRQQETELELDRAKQTLRETATFNALLQQELRQLQENQARTSSNCPLVRFPCSFPHPSFRLFPRPRSASPSPFTVSVGF